MKLATQLEPSDAMKAAMHESIDIIKAEHRALAAVINVLKLFVDEISAKRINPDFKLLWSILYYIETFPETLHHPKEDRYLFAKLRLRTHEGDALLDELERQHHDGNELVRELQAALGHFVAGKGNGFETFASAVQRFTDSNWKHMSLEEREVLPLAEIYLTSLDWKTISKAFQQNQDPLTGISNSSDLELSRLFTQIVNLVPAPLGLGGASF